MSLLTIPMMKAAQGETWLELRSGNEQRTESILAVVVVESIDVICGENGMCLANALLTASLTDDLGNTVQDAWNFQDGDFTGARLANELVPRYDALVEADTVNYDDVVATFNALLEKALD